MGWVKQDLNFPKLWFEAALLMTDGTLLHQCVGEVAYDLRPRVLYILPA